MEKTKEKIKSAFIDAICITDDIQDCPLSNEIDNKVLRFCKKNSNKFYKYFNTTSKRIACIILTVILCLTTTVLSVEALRQPVVEAIQGFFVNVKEQLTGTRANNIADYFIDDITQIKATNYFTTVPKEHVISEKQKIDEFIKLLAKTDWGNPRNEYVENVQYVFWKFEFKKNDEVVTTLNLCESPAEVGCIEIINNNSSKVFVISEQIYRDILAFTNTKYYLHKSDIAIPHETTCLSVKNDAFYNLTVDEKEFVCNELRVAHMQIENMLLDSVSTLKDPDSQYWQPAISGEPFEDPFSGEKYINGDWCFNSVIEYLDNISNTIKNNEVKAQFKAMSENLKKACNNHDIGGIFAIHEFIHDYDYFAINYPAYFELLAPPDWNGINVYFGHFS